MRCLARTSACPRARRSGSTCCPATCLWRWRRCSSLPDQQRTLIRGGLVVDGTGGVPYVGDVLLAGDRILAVGPSLTETADTVIDAAGCAVCPGFVDIHRHLDAKAIMNWGGETELRQGITSTVVGNCGFSLAPNSATHRAAQRAFDEPILGPLPEEYP
ncbi:MAG: amidohydrolase family protein, partial [Clostridiales bacterium]|nr:amidohydrolase family protein [Clostridiales bacterium]